MTESADPTPTTYSGLDTVAVAHLHPGRLSTHFQGSLDRLYRHDPAVGFPPLRIKSTLHLAPARNTVVRMFLDSTTHDWLLMLDADMGFAPDVAERLRAAADPEDRPMVGALCFTSDQTAVLADHTVQSYVHPTIYQQVEDAGRSSLVPLRSGYPANALVECAGTGAACVLMHRGMLDRMRQAYGEHWYSPIVDESGLVGFGEDLAFCIRARQLGVPVFVHTGVRTCHEKTAYARSGGGDPWPPTPPEVAITGTFHGRLGWTAQLLQQCRVPCGDEAYWNLNGRHAGPTRVDVSWVAASQLAGFSGTVFHQTRDPLRVLESVLAAGIFEQPGPLLRRTLIRLVPDLDDHPPVVSAMRAIVAWIETVEEQSELTWRVEDLDTDLLIELSGRLGSEITESRARRALERVERSEVQAPSPLTPEDLPGGPIKDAFLSLVRRLGYDPRDSIDSTWTSPEVRPVR